MRDKQPSRNQKLAHDYAQQLRAEGYSLGQATEHLSWQAALWEDDLPALSQAYRNEMQHLPEVYQ